MKHTTNCKFCRKVIYVTIDDSYDALGDPYGLLKYAACNACADARVDKRKSEERILATCTLLASLLEHPEKLAAARKRAEVNFLDATRKWCNAVGKVYFVPIVVDRAFGDSMLEHPDKATELLSSKLRDVRSQLQASLPYKD